MLHKKLDIRHYKIDLGLKNVNSIYKLHFNNNSLTN